MRVRWTSPALADLTEIATYVAEDQPKAAARLLSRIRTRVKDLAERPHQGRLGEAPDTRELVIDGTPYILVYRVTTDVLILSVFHGARERPDTF